MNAYFSETSKMLNTLLVAFGVVMFVMLGLLLWFAYSINEMMMFYIVVGAFFFSFSTLFLVATSALTLSIDGAGISYRFMPFVRSFKHFAWQDITKAEVVQYHPLKDFGGWGLRRSIRHGKAYTTKGNMGLQITLKNGEKILFTVIDAENARQGLAQALADQQMQ